MFVRIARRLILNTSKCHVRSGNCAISDVCVVVCVLMGTSSHVFDYMCSWGGV